MTEIRKTWAEQEAERKAAVAAFMATEPTAEELGRIRQGELGVVRYDATHAIGGNVDGYSRTLRRNVQPQDVDYMLRSLAENNGNIKDLHAYPEAF